MKMIIGRLLLCAAMFGILAAAVPTVSTTHVNVGPIPTGGGDGN